MGFLGARLVGSDLENPYEDFPDLSILTLESQIRVQESIAKVLGENADFNEFFFHQQGYGLADRIYLKYLTGQVSLSRLRHLFLADFSSNNGALREFARLKNEFWPQQSPQAPK